MESLRQCAVSLRYQKEVPAMIAKMILKLKSPMEQEIDRACRHFPVLSSIVLQLAAAIFMVGVVASIACVGGTIIWVFYKVFGVM